MFTMRGVVRVVVSPAVVLGTAAEVDTVEAVAAAAAVAAEVEDAEVWLAVLGSL